MPVIVLEGPDSSGKTTLAHTLKDLLDPFFEDLQVQHSPTKTYGWSDAYSHYLTDMADSHHGSLLIQDRVPEISEAIYAIGMQRGRVRGDGWVYPFYGWLTQDIFLLYCMGESQILNGLHHDVDGTRIQDAEHQLICRLYDMVFFNIFHTMILTHPHGFRMASYDRFDPHDWQRILTVISDWLCWQFPDKALDVRDALLTHSESPMKGTK